LWPLFKPSKSLLEVLKIRKLRIKDERAAEGQIASGDNDFHYGFQRNGRPCFLVAWAFRVMDDFHERLLSIGRRRNRRANVHQQ
jgi:hypothetical protein